ncbi:hypothetical protein RSPO_m01259 (plasmid) [Ralstonia solanacearum Po82]|uniref:Uncharacterized protein n=1 Tax=Ralstonia solanacearum (strain Po82) TaxID=1031711 RepID=F6G9I0_RALS8|nr:hypothetical protein RSPO_m01259 [Ralstonia solanacearum Po82]
MAGAATQAKRQLDQRVDRGEQPRRHRDRREKQEDHPPWKQDGIRQQKPEHATGCPHNRPSRNGGEPHHCNLRECSAQHTGHIQHAGTHAPQRTLDIPPEHEHAEHVEHQVRNAGVQKCVRQQLPGKKPATRIDTGDTGRPQREAAQQRVAREELRDKDDHVGEDKRTDHGRPYPFPHTIQRCGTACSPRCDLGCRHAQPSMHRADCPASCRCSTSKSAPKKLAGALQTGIAGRENRFADSTGVRIARHSSLPDTPSTRIGSCVPSLSAFTAW